ncbi:MAG: MFS transporter [Desulfuromonadales bacterium]
MRQEEEKIDAEVDLPGDAKSGAEPFAGARREPARRFSSVPTLLAVLGVLVLVQAFSGGMSILSFSRLHLDSLLSRHEAVGFDLQRQIERGLRFGKPLDRLIGIEDSLEKIGEHNPDLDNVTVNAADGRILHSLLPGRQGEPAHGANHWSAGESRAAAVGPIARHVVRDQHHHLLLPLRDRQEVVVGVLDLSFRDEIMEQKRSAITAASFRHLVASTLVAGLILLPGLWLVSRVPRLRGKNAVIVLLFLVLGAAQLIHTFSNVSLFRRSLTEITQAKVATVAQLTRQEIEALLDLGIRIDNLVDMEAQLERTLADTPEMGALRILDGQMRTLYAAGEEKIENGEKLPLRGPEEARGYLAFALSGQQIAAKSREIALDSLTVMVISFLFLVEVLIFLARPLGRLGRVHREEGDAGALIRPATASFMFAAALCYSFIPLYAETVYRPFFDMSREFVLGLPLTAEMLFGGLALIPVGIWIDRRGWHQPFLIGIVLCAAGTFLSALAQGPADLIFYRAVAGLGYGFTWMAAQGCVLLHTTGKNRARGISGIVAGIFSGIICGSAVGALLASRIGFGGVFCVAGFFMLFSLGFTLVCLRRFFCRPPADGRADAFSFTEFRRFILDREVLRVLGCSLLPYSVAMVALLYYVSPIYLGRMGVSQADIGRAIMIFGLCMIGIAPQVARFADALPDKRVLVALGGFLGGGGLLLFHFLEGYAAVLPAILLLGISVSISAASRNVLTIELPAARRLGMSKVMGVYRSVDKLGQSLGPLIVGILLIRLDIPQAMTVLGIAWIAVTVLFMTGVREKTVQPQSAD